MEFQHVDPQAAVEIHKDIKSNFSLGIHWGTFNLSYEVNKLCTLNKGRGHGGVIIYHIYIILFTFTFLSLLLKFSGLEFQLALRASKSQNLLARANFPLACV